MQTSILVAALALVGCTKTPAYLYGRDFTNLQFHAYDQNVGIYPYRSILDDPNNPFASDAPTDDGKWVLEANAGPVAAFYSWATINAVNPYGEAQYYTAHDLQQIFRTGQASKAELPVAQDLAIRAYQAVLDHFPDSVTYDETGKIAFSLATLSYQGIVGLGGTVQGGWVLVKSDDGTEHAVHP
ncbi:MAG: putative lipoprotein [Myxococcales bacterium]|nr:putative lipoprotein [Myxococcales bacterium]